MGNGEWELKEPLPHRSNRELLDERFEIRRARTR